MPRCSACAGIASAFSASSMMISPLTFIPGSRSPTSSIWTVTGYWVTPLLEVLSRLTFVTCPVKVSPSNASTVTSTFCPTSTSRTSSSSTYMSKVSADISYMIAIAVLLSPPLLSVSPAFVFLTITWPEIGAVIS